jgi:hypothetical protein
MATLAILGMCNAVSSWQRNENVDVAQISAEFAWLVIDGIGTRPAASRRRR